MYVERNSEGKITGLYARKQRPDHEYVPGAQIEVTEEAPPTTMELSDAILGDTDALQKVKDFRDKMKASQRR